MDIERPRISRVFYGFVCVTLTLLLVLNGYAYLWGHPLADSLDGGFSDIKYVVKQLMHGLQEVNNKHERLQTEISRIASSLPVMAASANRAKNILEPLHQAHSQLSVQNYDQQISDYALESAGGKVLDTGDTVDYVLTESTVGYALYMLSNIMCRSCVGARAILQPGSLPGECWAFSGSRGEVTIRLLRSIYVTGVSLEHIPPHISPTKEISSAPRLFQVDGIESRTDQYPHAFGTFEYDRTGKQIQYFKTKPSLKPYHMIKLMILSNWGNSVYTCLYRFRVHGELSREVTRSSGDAPRIDIKL